MSSIFTPDQQRIRELLNVAAITVAGDIGGLTCYTNKHGRLICFPVSPPTKPPSPLQTKQRLRFKTAQQGWRALGAQQKAAYETACRRLSIAVTGQNAWISLALVPDAASFADLQRASPIPLTQPTAVPP